MSAIRFRLRMQMRVRRDSTPQPEHGNALFARVRTDTRVVPTTRRTRCTSTFSWCGNTTHSDDPSPFTKFVPEPFGWRSHRSHAWRLADVDDEDRSWGAAFILEESPPVLVTGNSNPQASLRHLSDKAVLEAAPA